MDDANIEGAFSLADLAEVDLTNIEEIRFENLKKGVYDFEVSEADTASDPKDGEPRYKVTIGIKVLEMLSSIEPGVDLEKQAGKSHTERFFIYPKRSEEEAAKAIGRVKALIVDITGEPVPEGVKFGDAVANLKGIKFRGRIEERKDRNDPSIKYATLRLDKKA